MDVLDIQRQIRDLADRLERLEKADLARHIGARIYKSTDQSISNNTTTAITFDTERWDTDSFHEGVTNPTRLTIPYTGYYVFGAGLEWATAATASRREIFIRMNGTTRLVDDEVGVAVGNTANPRMNCASYYSFTAGDYIEMMVFQNSGGALNANASVNYSPEFWIVYVGTN